MRESTDSVAAFERYRSDPRRILVTGGTGFIGRPLVDVLVGHGHQVTVLTRSAPLVRSPEEGAVDYITDLEQIANDVEFDAVINLYRVAFSNLL